MKSILSKFLRIIKRGDRIDLTTSDLTEYNNVSPAWDFELPESYHRTKRTLLIYTTLLITIIFASEKDTITIPAPQLTLRYDYVIIALTLFVIYYAVGLWFGYSATKRGLRSLNFDKGMRVENAIHSELNNINVNIVSFIEHSPLADVDKINNAISRLKSNILQERASISKRIDYINSNKNFPALDQAITIADQPSPHLERSMLIKTTEEALNDIMSLSSKAMSVRMDADKAFNVWDAELKDLNAALNEWTGRTEPSLYADQLAGLINKATQQIEKLNSFVKNYRPNIIRERILQLHAWEFALPFLYSFLAVLLAIIALIFS